MSKQVTYARLQKTLKELGFEEMRLNGAHVIFRHGEKGAVLSVPKSSGSVPPVYVNTAARQIANSGIATTDDFKQRLMNGVRKSAIRPLRLRTSSIRHRF